ncbi:transcription factor, contains a PHD finger motif [Gnomoniopsis smithogilvyi]|uniref:Transcription factor, contains a PHD finger motif n=1 Tax=Gnomoniopsis smithogilvyi TaxID=1191159 RepID=A0A9W8YLS1_9PEZI|nr:transcription factor, contains a PHD finger motif [Gnomoniopsis smithogilvyi]
MPVPATAPLPIPATVADHSPAVSSPLNPDQTSRKSQAPEESGVMAREKRTKKESLKKRESKAASTPGGLVELARTTPDPRQLKKKLQNVAPAEKAPARYILPLPKSTDFEPAHGPMLVSHHETTAPDGETIEFFETQEHVYNKKQYYYTHCIADPKFPSSFYYRQTEPEPFGPHMSFEDAATHLQFDKSGRHITTDKGWRMSRANVAIREGRWYWECKITRGILKEPPPPGSEQPESHGHVRIGFARREAAIDAPAGFDAYSYGIRDKEGQSVYMSRPKAFFPPGEELREGDVIGLELNLPSEQLHRKVVSGDYNPAVDLLEEADHESTEASNIVRDRLPIRFKAHIYFETPDYHTTPELEDLMNPSPMSSTGAGAGSTEGPNPNHPVPCMRTLPNSWIKVYKNGVDMGVAFTNLLAFLPPASKPATAKQPDAREGLDDGMLGYYPAVSVFRGGAAEVNFGPSFAEEDVAMTGTDEEPTVKVKQEAPRPLAERYDEQIVEDIVYDIVDEVDFWMQDGAKVIDRTRKGTNEEVKEFKEVVQDV